MLASLLALSVLAAAPAPAANLDAQQAFDAGLARYREADFEGAIPLFQRAVMATPDSESAKKATEEIWLGLSFLNIGNTELARSSFRAALLADIAAVLPDEAPPAATPIFANIKGDLERAARRNPQQVATAPTQPESQPMDAAKPSDVPHAEPAPAPPAAAAAEIHPDLTQPAVEEPSRHRYPVWVAPAVGGLAVALGGAAVGLKAASNGSFDQATNAPVAARAAELSSRGDSQQHTARILAFSAVGVAVVAGVLYLLNE